jgi:endonuclease/exonuclease/phosphatase family metal-dependent hydrolase
MRRRAFLIHLLVLLALVVGSTTASAKPFHDTPVGPDRTITVMTRNLYFGADLTPVVAAPDLDSFLAEAVGALGTSLASDFAARGAAVAREIAANDPALVGLQEATWWHVGGPSPVDVDFVGIIRQNLAALGEPYRVVASVPGFDVALGTPLLPYDVRLTVGDVLLAREDLPTSWLKISNVQWGHYSTTFAFESPIGDVEFPRQWISADVKVRGQEIRFITTHLESVAAPYRIGQALELLAGPAATDLPVVVVGDLNSEIDDSGDAAAAIVADGFSDAWSTVNGPDGGYTCCQDPLLRNDPSELSSRIDLVLTRGGFGVTAVHRTSTEPDHDLSELGVLYPSDHAGVVADLVIPR